MSDDTSGAPKRLPFHEAFAERVIKHLEAGTAPWQKPWHPGNQLMAPHNPTSGTVYKGVNRVNLALTAMAEGYDDPRWLTMRQANDMGLRIKKGSKASGIIFYQFTQEKTRLDEDGKPVIGEDGKPEKETVLLEKPIVRGAHVFNGAQIEGMPPLQLTDKAYGWVPVEKAESILAASGAVIKHDQSDRAFYRYTEDAIHLPPKENFPAPEKYYGTALHELGHWTRHETRLNRENGPFGSELYAREELRAEIASWMLGEDIGVPHDPEQHTAYVASWIKALQEDPYEIVRACRDAEHIKGYVMGLEQRKELAQEKAPEQALPANPATEKTFLQVPYLEKNAARKAGARWDSESKLWFAPEGADLAKLAAWMPDKSKAPEKLAVLSPQEEFAKALEAAGLDLRGRLPEMDGQIHRVPLLDDKPGALNASYCGYSDGTPNGWAHNFSTGDRTKWVANGHTLTEEQKQNLQREAAERQQARMREIETEQARIAEMCRAYFTDRPPANSDHPYLVRKGIQPEGLKVTPNRAELIVPMINTDGEIRSLQYIAEDGTKRFQAGGQKKGCFHLIGAKLPDDEKSLAQGEILLAEGVATGASLREATGKPVAVAFDSGNLEAVAVKLREKFPNAAITICADNDHKHRRNDTLYNVGVERAKTAAQAVGGTVKVPVFTKEEKDRNLTDFNDLHKARGLDAVRRQFGGREKSRGRSMGHERGLSL